ncbi:MAG TPA: GtrA family protein [Nocardioides sp.]|nr:GtrA family protein [Nocardioides sp.]
MGRPALLPGTVVRFATVGVANTVIDLALFGMLLAPLGLLRANLVSTSVGMVFSFVANGRHTFGVTSLTGRQALAFLATNGFTMWLLQPSVIILAHAMLGAPLLLAKTAALASSVVTNFALYRYAVFPVRPSQPTAGLAAAPEAVRR